MAKSKTPFIHKPIYPGGKSAMSAFIEQEIKYPQQAQKNKTEGTVKVEYSLNQKGKVMSAKAVSGPQDGCREEAERVVKMLRFAVPKDSKLKNIRYRQYLNINFKLPKQQEQESTKMQINYNVTSKSNDTKPPQKGNNFGYTISW